MAKQPFQRLQIWQKAMDLADLIYDATESFPQKEMYALTLQIRKAAFSVPSNIAEGSQRGTNKDFANFILIAKGSLAEGHTQLLFSERRKYLSAENARTLYEKIEELNKMMFSFYQKITPVD